MNVYTRNRGDENMPMYYNENGDLQEYARWTQLAKCKKCGKPYRQECEEQVPGFRDRDYDICPYCGHENGSSMSYEYYNHKLSDEEIEKYME